MAETAREEDWSGSEQRPSSLTPFWKSLKNMDLEIIGRQQAEETLEASASESAPRQRQILRARQDGGPVILTRSGLYLMV